MQTVIAFASKAMVAAAHAVKAGAHAVGIGKTAAQAGTTAAKVSTAGSSWLKALRVGTSAVSALSTYQQGQAQARADEADAFNEDLQARQEFIQSQEQANEIQRAYNQVVADQMSVAAASGIDVSSGSVIEARRDAQTQADRQLTISRNGAALNASLRRGRAAALRARAAAGASNSLLGAVAKVGEGYLETKKVG